MFVYLISFALSTLLLHFCVKAKRNCIRLFFAVASILSLSIIAGFRDLNVGTDLQLYGVSVYEEVRNSSSFSNYFVKLNGIEVGYAFLNYLCFHICEDVHFFLFVLNAVFVSILFVTVYKFRGMCNSKAFYVLMLLLWYNQSFNALRQSIAVALVFLSYYFLIDKKNIRVLICIAIALLFHQSAVFAFLLYLAYYAICTAKKTKTIQIVFIAMGMVGYLFYSIFLTRFIEFGFVSDKYAMYLDHSAGESLVQLFFLVFLYLFTFVVKKLNPPYSKFIIALRCFIPLCFFIQLTSKYNDVASRFSIYFFVGVITFYMIVFKKCRNGNYFSILFVVAFLIKWIYFAVKTGQSETIPYCSQILMNFFV